MNRLRLPTLGLLAALSAAACGDRPGGETAAGAASAGDAEGVALVGDWDEIVERGVLRLARQPWSGYVTLPRQGLRAEQFQHIAERFARQHGLAVQWVEVAGFSALIPSVRDGLADIAVANITITEPRRREVAFSRPLTLSREWLVGRPGSEAGSASDRIGVPAGTAYTLSAQQHYPDVARVPVPADTDPMGVLTRLEQGEFEITIMDEANARAVIASSDRVQKIGEVPGLREHAWALRREDAELKRMLDAYLLERHVGGIEEDGARTWPDIVASGTVRMATLNDATTYYLWRGELLGYEYEMAELFAAAEELELQVLVAPDIDALLAMVQTGRADFASASLTPTAERSARGLAFTTGYLTTRETFVTAGAPIADVEALAGRRVVVNRATSYASTLRAWQDRRFELAEVDEPPSSILGGVLDGRIDATLIDGHRAEITAAFDDRLRLGLRLDPARPLSWAVAEDNAGLLEALNQFIAANQRGYDFNVLRNKYFKNRRRMSRQREHRVTGATLSPYDELVRASVQDRGLDWRLVVSQMYEESGFDPDQVSFAGARGLMQVMPNTARGMGFDPERLAEPETGIEAGVRYLDWTRERFPDLSPGERLWFSLAAYNAGPGHVRDARRLAEALELDAGRWFDNVERAILKLAEPEHARKAMFGYVRGTETVGYVRDIRDRYLVYLEHFRLLEQRGAGAAASEE